MNNGGMPGGGGGGMARMRSLNNGRPEEKIDPKAKSKVLRGAVSTALTGANITF